MIFGRNRKNRRNKRDNVLEVKLQARQVRAARIRVVAKVLLVVACLTVGSFGLWKGSNWVLDRWVYSNPAFNIRLIHVRTDGIIPEEQILIWAGVNTGESLLALDLSRVERDLELQPWIESVAVERVLPSTLRIRISEREPIAQILGFLPTVDSREFKLATFYVDRAGYTMLPPKPLRRYTIEIPKLGPFPALTGIRATELRPGKRVDSPQMRSALRLAAMFEHSPMAGLVDLEEVDLSVPGVLTARTRQRSEVIFALEELERQFRRWRLIHDYALSEGKYLATLDLSVSNNVPARWQEIEAPPPPKAKPRTSSRIGKKHV